MSSPPTEMTAQRSARSEDMPFNFLGLPTELRLMVYERLPQYTTRHTFRPPVGSQDPSTEISVTGRGMSMSILATCKLIHEEARPIVQKAAEQWIYAAKPRLDFTLRATAFQSIGYAVIIMMLYRDIWRSMSHEFAVIGLKRSSARPYLWEILEGPWKEAEIMTKNSKDFLQETGCEEEVLGFVRKAARLLDGGLENPFHEMLEVSLNGKMRRLPVIPDFRRFGVWFDWVQ